jgi:hypothetical protein
MTVNQPSLPSFATLPTEVHLLISQQLIYPDALSLKHVNRYFYSLVNTGIKLKVAWLLERRTLHLDCPNDRSCDFGTDLKFCRGSVRCVLLGCGLEVCASDSCLSLHRLLMQRRREHIECESRPGLGCLIYGTRICAHRRKLTTRVKRIFHPSSTWQGRCAWFFVAMLPLIYWLIEALVHKAVMMRSAE